MLKGFPTPSLSTSEVSNTGDGLRMANVCRDLVPSANPLAIIRLQRALLPRVSWLTDRDPLNPVSEALDLIDIALLFDDGPRWAGTALPPGDINGLLDHLSDCPEHDPVPGSLLMHPLVLQGFGLGPKRSRPLRHLIGAVAPQGPGRLGEG